MKIPKKTILIFFLFLVILTVNFNNIRTILRNNLSHETKIFFKEIFFGKKYIEEIFYYKTSNYNQKILPETQFEIIDFKKIKLDELKFSEKSHYEKVNNINLKRKHFFLEIIDNQNLLYVASKGRMGLVSFEDYKEKSQIKNNLKEYNISSILDSEIINNQIFISIASHGPQGKNCTFFLILNAELNFKYLNFKKFYETNTCLESTLGGRIVKYSKEGINGFLVSTGASDKKINLAQDSQSPYGKILFFDLLTKNYEIFSMGHRNPQGLINFNDIIISTEHGPYGGDEINRIEYKKNYGFSLVSLGEPYSFKNNLKNNLKKNYVFKKKHKENGFQEPIFSFIPSIGISEIIDVPNNFSKYWIDSFFITSLNGRSIFRVNFDKNFSKINYLEKIYIGERIRDIKYNKNQKTFLLALEETGSIGIFKIFDEK